MPRSKSGFHTFGTPFYGYGLNTDMTQDRSPPPSGTPIGFISLPFPPIPRPVSSEFSMAPILAKRAQRLAAQAYWDLLRQLLTRKGHPASLDRIAYDPDEGWRIYFLGADPGLVAAMHEVAVKENCPDDLSAFDAHDQVRNWLRRIEYRIVYPLDDSSLVGSR